ncbi:MAG: autotransporter-associated beta strand repeat-containing protein, partial [Verrucomicrobiota bacterium]
NAQTWNNDYAFTGTNNLNLGTGAVNLGSTAGTRTVTVNAGTLAIGGVVSSGTATSLTKAGAGALTLSNNNSGGFAGGVTLNAGTLNINNNNALGNTAGFFVINGGSIDNTSGAAISANNYKMTWNSDVNFIGASDGTHNLSLGAGAVTLGTAAGTSRTLTVNAGTLTVGGVIGNGTTANSLVKAGAGTLTLAGTNTFSGGFALTAGSLVINNASALGAVATSALTINGGTIYGVPTGGGTAVLSSYAQTWAGDFSFGFAGMATDNNLGLGAGAVTLSGTGTTRAITTAGQFGTLTVGGVISDGATVKGLTKNGPGILLLTAANAFTGGIILNAGTLTISNAAALGTGTLTINGGFLNNNGANLTLSSNNAQAWNADFTVTGSTLNYQPCGFTFGTGAITLGGNRTVTNAGSNLTEGGAISDGGSGYGLTLVAGLFQNFGAATTLSGANTYSGATVVQSRNGIGSVTLSGTLANTSSVTVNSGGSFSANAAANNPINPLATLTLGGNGGGTFARNGGTNIQSFTSLTVGSGADVLSGYFGQSQFTFSGSNPYLRSVGGVVRINSVHTASAFTSAPSGAGNVIGSGATAMLIGATKSTDYTATSADNFVKAAAGAMTALTGTSTWGTGINTDLSANASATGSVTQSLRFTAGLTLTLPGAFTVESGGILASNAPTGPVTLTGGTLATGIAGGDLWIVQGGAASTSVGMIVNSQIIDNTGSSLTKVGPRALYLTNPTNSYTGGTYLAEGILNVASEGSLGSGALNITGAGTLQAAGNVALGSRAVTLGQGVTGSFDTNGYNIAVGGAISGAFSGLTKNGAGTLTLSGANTYTGITTVTNGTLKLDFSAAGAPTSDIISANSLLNLGSVLSYGAPAWAATSDTVLIQGKAGTANSQSFSGVSPNPLIGSVLINQGMTHLNLVAGAGGTLAVNLGSLTKGVSGNNTVNIGLDIAIGSGVTVTTTTPINSTTGLLATASNATGGEPWVTVNGSTWATLSGNTIVGLANASYNTNINNGGNLDLLATGTMLTTAGNPASLRFNDTSATGADMSLTLRPALQTSIQSVLVTSNVGAHTSTIAGALLQGTGRRDLSIYQNNSAGDLVISSQIVDTNGGETISKYGAGRLILTGVNTNTGYICVNEGTLLATGDFTPQVIKTGLVTTGGSAVVPMSDTSGLFVGQVMTGTGTGGSGGSNYSVILAITPGVNITLSSNISTGGTITGTFQSGGALGGSGQSGGNGGAFIPVMIGTSGTLQIGNGSNHGSIDPNYQINNLGALVLSRSDAYTFGNVISGNVVSNTVTGTLGTNTLEIKGSGTATLGFSGTVNGSGVAAQAIYTLSAAGNVYAGQSVTGTNIPANTTVAYVDGLNVKLSNNIATGGASNVTFTTTNT